ncbi:MAG: endolytic transglycosylase MltG [Elusimicrobiota bacterium]|nr:endolytic transglycosylase MltG [Elusimicrobiota bacterium]
MLKFKKKSQYYHLKIICIVAMFLILIILSAYKLISSNMQSSDIKNIEIQIKSGLSTKKIANILKSNNLIKNESLFVGLIKLLNYDGKLKSGTYKFSKNTGIINIIRELKLGRDSFVKVNIPEGFNRFDIALRLENLGIGKKETYLKIIEMKNLEGHLYPDTYFFSETSKEEEVIEKMEKTFRNKTDNLFLEAETKGILKNNKFSKQEILTMASIIEKEAVLDRERAIIASVFYNRLKKNIALQSCATVQYAIQEKTGIRKKRLLYKDLEINSEYNTYKNIGLPKNPICSPSLKSIKAALYPADTNYLFFVLSDKNDDSHVFSTKFRDHVIAKNLR